MQQMCCPGSQQMLPDQLLRTAANQHRKKPLLSVTTDWCLHEGAETGSARTSAGRLRRALGVSSEIKNFLAQQNGKAREISGDGRTVGLSNRLQKGQGENQRIPIGRKPAEH